MMDLEIELAIERVNNFREEADMTRLVAELVPTQGIGDYISSVVEQVRGRERGILGIMEPDRGFARTVQYAVPAILTAAFLPALIVNGFMGRSPTDYL